MNEQKQVNVNESASAQSALNVGLGDQDLRLLPRNPYTWKDGFWMFYVAQWGGEMKLRIDTKSESRPMTYEEGVRHINRMYA